MREILNGMAFGAGFCIVYCLWDLTARATVEYFQRRKQLKWSKMSPEERAIMSGIEGVSSAGTQFKSH